MSFMGGITDFLTGGSNSQAEEALRQAEAAFGNIQTPNISQLTLPELQQYVQAGLMTPAQAQAVLEQSNAYDNISTDPGAKMASADALSKLSSIGDANGMDATEKAKLAQISSTQNQQLGSQRASIMDQMDQRGIPSSLMAVAEQLGAAGQDSEQAHQDALTANADASQRALQALEASGTLGTQIEQQNYGEQAQKAQAANAIQQWNAANATTVNLNNASMKQQANAYNTQTAQAASNANVQNSNARTQYNAGLPQQVFNDQITKANGEAGVFENQAKNYQHMGEQNAGTAGMILGTAANVGGNMAMAPGAAPGASSAAAPAATDAIMLASHGGPVPGIPHTPGDSPKNDTVPALLSPGEVVIPRSHAQTPQTAASFIKHLHRQTARPPIHPDDVKSVLHALTSIRGGI